MYKTKRGQLKLSFGMIFSIILIVIFISFAFYAIQKFLSLQESVIISQFTENLQNDIDKMWKGSQGSRNVEYSLPNKINSICFLDDEYENLVFNSDKLMGGSKIEHIDITKILEKEDPFCIENKEGKISLTIKKDYGDALVSIEK